MKLVEVLQVPKYRIRFSKAESDLLNDTARIHYDGVCRSLAECGGTLYGLNNHFLLGAEFVELDMWFREVDLLCKVMEYAMIGDPKCPLYWELRRVLIDVNTRPLPGSVTKG